MEDALTVAAPPVAPYFNLRAGFRREGPLGVKRIRRDSEREKGGSYESGWDAMRRKMPV